MIKKIGLIVAVIALVSVMPVSAHNGVEHSSREAAIAHAREEIDNNKTAVCERAQTRLDNRLKKSEPLKEKYLDRYQLTVDRLNNIAVRLNENDSGINIDQLSKDIGQLNDHIKNFETNFADYTASIRSAINTPCPSDGDLTGIRQAASEIRDARKTVRESVDTIRDFINDDVVNHLKDIQKAVDESSTTTTEGTDE